MHKFKIIMILLISTILSFSSESIKNFNMNLEVLPNGVLKINEQIVYNTDENGKHGIYKIIPYKYSKGSYFKFENKIAIRNFKVTDKAGNEIEVLREVDGNEVYYRIGSEDKIIPANEDYIFNISYNIYNVMRKKDQVVQIYFNALGNYWEMPVENFNLKILGISGDIKVYTGFVGETNSDYTIDNKNDEYYISTTREFKEGEGLTFILNSNDFKYTNYDLWMNRFYSYLELVLVPIILLILLIINISALLTKIRNKVKGIIVVEYLPPKLSPIMAKKIISGEFVNYTNYNNFMIVLFQLIDKNIVLFKEKNEKHNNEEYVRKVGETYNKKVKGFDDYVEKVYYVDVEVADDYFDKQLLSKEEKIVLNKLILVKNDIFKNSKIIYELEMELINYINENYRKNYSNRVLRYFYYLVMTFLITLILTIFGIVIEPIALAIMYIFSFLTLLNVGNIYKYTDLYKKEYFKVKGFYKFLSLVEREKFRYFTNIDDIVSYFKKILPYALAFGMENNYLKLLDSVIIEHDLDREIVYSKTNYYHVINRMYYYNIINNSINSGRSNGSRGSSRNSHGGSSSFTGGFSNSGFSGGGFSGGGGRSW